MKTKVNKYGNDFKILQYCVMAIINERAMNEELKIGINRATALTWVKSMMARNGWSQEQISSIFDETIEESNINYWSANNIF